jgi:uncharacterized protein with von Willebrand factor type A (vWA) domain
VSRFRYRRYGGEPDPLTPPFDSNAAVDALAERVMSGDSVRQALRELWERGWQTRQGLSHWRRMAQQRRQQLRRSGQLDGLLQDVVEMLDQALTAERAELFADPSDDARFREAMLDMLPDSPAGAIRELRDYDWQSPQARSIYESLVERIRRDVLDQQFKDLSNALSQMGQSGTDGAVKEMLDDLNELLGAANDGTATEEDYAQFLDKHGRFFPDAPETLSEFIDDLARRAAAAQRLFNSLTPEQREELARLAADAFDDPAMAAAMAQLQQNLSQLRGDLDWGSSQSMSGGNRLGLPDATEALAELAEIDALAEQFGTGGSTVDPLDIDEEAVARLLGQNAAEELRELQQLAEQLRTSGLLDDDDQLTPKAIRRIGAHALRTVFDDMTTSALGDHDTRTPGAAGEFTGHTRAWQFGDEQPLDPVSTVRNALLRDPTSTRRPVRLRAEDFAVRETDDRSRAAVALLVDQSFSMWVNDTWRPAKTTALALSALISGAYPTDAFEIISFANLAQRVHPGDLPQLAAAEIQGTNLHHALLLAGRFFDRHRGATPMCLVITDGEPTAHVTASGDWSFCWPPDPHTINLTVAQVDAMTRRDVTISWFRLGDDPRLARFIDAMAQRNRGRVLAPNGESLGRYVVSDFVRSRNTRR